MSMLFQLSMLCFSAFYAPYQEDRHEDSAYLDLAQVRA